MRLAPKFKHIEADIAVDDIGDALVIECHVVGLRRRPPTARLRDEMADLARRERIADVDDAQAAAEPRGKADRSGHALAELMRAEARAGRTRERRIELAHLELPERLDVGGIGDVEGENAGMRPAAPHLLLVGALRLIFFVDREGDAL